MFNVVRPKTIPASLHKKTKYGNEDVYMELKSAFYDKCYLCETKEPNDVNIEHFDAHMGDIDKKFDWKNLYFVCSRCNNIKGARFNNLIDCCDQSTDVSRLIKLLPPHTPYSKTITVMAMDTKNKTQQTEQLLDKVYNSDHTINKNLTATYLRKNIFKQYSYLLKELNKYYSPVATEVEKSSALESIKVLIDKKAPYSAFIRWCILDDEELCPKLEGFMD